MISKIFFIPILITTLLINQEVEVIDMFTNGLTDTCDICNNEMLLRFTNGRDSVI